MNPMVIKTLRFEQNETFYRGVYETVGCWIDT